MVASRWEQKKTRSLREQGWVTLKLVFHPLPQALIHTDTDTNTHSQKLSNSGMRGKETT